jgi:hypothetical protein
VADDVAGASEIPDQSASLARDVMRYVAAVAGYVGIGALTKNYLSFTWGLVYFVTVLDALPRALRRLRSRAETPPEQLS